MAEDPFGKACAGFRRWAKTATQDDLGEVGLLTDLMRDHLDIERPADLTAAGLSHLLLRVYPRKVVVDGREDAYDTVRILHDYFAYLASAGDVTAAARSALDRTADELADEFADAVMDPANWGPGRTFATAMQGAGVDMNDRAAVRRFITQYNADMDAGLAPGLGHLDDYEEAADDEEHLDIKEAFGLPDEMPPIRLPSQAELAAQARSAPMIAQLRALAAWLGEQGRPVDDELELPQADRAEAAAEAGVPESRLQYLWHLALDTGFAEVDEVDEDDEDAEDDDTKVITGEIAEDWPDYSDHDVLEIWAALFNEALLSVLEIAADADPDRARDLEFGGSGIAVAVMLFLAGGNGLPVVSLSDALKTVAIAGLVAEKPAKGEQAWRSWISAHGDPARLVLEQLAVAGGVEFVPDPDVVEVVRLTGLGRTAVRTQFIEAGVEVPLLPDPAEMTAAELITMGASATEEEFDAEAAAWWSHRTAEEGAGELLSFAATADGASRTLAVTVVTMQGAPAKPAWRAVLGEPALRGYAKAALATLAGEEYPELDDQDLAWMLTDALTLDGWDDTDQHAEHDPAELTEVLGKAVPAGHEAAMLEMMARSAHPQVADVLTVIGRHHPDKKVAKAARKAAYKAATRQAAKR